MSSSASTNTVPHALIHIHNNLLIALGDVEKLCSSQKDGPEGYFVIPVLQNIRRTDLDASLHCLNVEGFLPSCLSDIARFDSMVNNVSNSHPHSKLVFSTTTEPEYQRRLVFLLGCHMIMRQGLGFEEAYLAFRPMHDVLEESSIQNLSVRRSLRAFCCAKCLGWIDFNRDFTLFTDEENRTMICMDEYDHYARYAMPHPLDARGSS